MQELYDDLLVLAEREHALLAAGAWEDLAALDAQRRDLLARLPAAAPATARAVLERALAVQAQSSAALAGGVDGLRRELATLSQGRAAVRGYGAAGAAAAGPGAASARLDLAG